MCIFEFNEEKYMKMERENAYQSGFEEGENKLLQLVQLLKTAGREADLKYALSDQSYREQLYIENNL